MENGIGIMNNRCRVILFTGSKGLGLFTVYLQSCIWGMILNPKGVRPLYVESFRQIHSSTNYDKLSVMVL